MFKSQIHKNLLALMSQYIRALQNSSRRIHICQAQSHSNIHVM